MSENATTTPAQSTGTEAAATGPAGTDPGLGGPLAQTADPIDRVVRLAPRWTLFVLAACALLVAGALVWAFTGTITTTVTAGGILKDNGYLGVSAQQPGEVQEVLVRSGQQVAAGAPLVALAAGTTIAAPQAATVAAIYVAAGSTVKAGSIVVGLTDPDIPDVVLTMLPASQVGTVVAGLPAQMDVDSAPAATYGYLKGTVLEVSNLPMTTTEVAQTLGMERELVEQSMGTAPGLLTVIGVTPDTANPSHYAWTVGTGPNFLISQGSPMTVEVILSESKPIRVVFPAAETSAATSATSAARAAGPAR